MADAGSMFVRLGLKGQQFFTGMNKAQKETKKTGKDIDKLGASMKRMRSIAMTAFSGWAIYRVTKQIVQLGAAFEQNMAVVGAVTRSTAKEFEDLTAIARKMGEQTEWSANQAAQGLKFLGMAGFGAQKSIAALPGVLDLATAGSLDLGRAADIATNALTGMGLNVLELGRVNDVFVGTITRSNVNMEMMAESFKYAAPLAKAYGVDVERLSSMIGILGNAGVQGSMAGTQLAFAFQRVDKVWKELGVDGTGKDLIDALKAIKDAGWDNAKVMQVFGMRAGRAALILKDLTAEVDNLDIALRNSKGEAKALADEMRATLGGQWKEFKSVVESIALDTFGLFADQLKTLVSFSVSQLRLMQKEWKAIASLIAGPQTQEGAFKKTLEDINKELELTKKNLGIIDKSLLFRKEHPILSKLGLVQKSTISTEDLQKFGKEDKNRIKELEKQLAKYTLDIDAEKVSGVYNPKNVDINKKRLAEIEEIAKANKLAAKDELEAIGAPYRAAQEVLEFNRSRVDEEIKLEKKALDEKTKLNNDYLQGIVDTHKDVQDNVRKDAIESIEQESAARDKALADNLKRQKEHDEKLKKIHADYLKAIESKTSDMIYDMFTGQIRGFEDVIDQMKDMFFKMLADMAAKAIAKPILMPIMSTISESLLGPLKDSLLTPLLSGILDPIKNIGKDIAGSITDSLIGSKIGEILGVGAGAAGGGLMGALGGALGAIAPLAAPAMAVYAFSQGKDQYNDWTREHLGQTYGDITSFTQSLLMLDWDDMQNMLQDTATYASQPSQNIGFGARGLQAPNIDLGKSEYNKYAQGKVNENINYLNSSLESFLNAMPQELADNLLTQMQENFNVEIGGSNARWRVSDNGTGWAEVSNVYHLINERLRAEYTKEMGGQTLEGMGVMTGLDKPLGGTDLMTQYESLKGFDIMGEHRREIQTFIADLNEFQDAFDPLAGIFGDAAEETTALAMAFDIVLSQFADFETQLIDMGANLEGVGFAEKRADALREVMDAGVSGFRDAWNNFVNDVNFSDLAPVQSAEMFENRFNELFNQAEAGDFGAYQELLNFTQNDLLPFAQQFGGYQETFDRLMGSEGILSTMEVDLGVVSDNIGEQLADVLGEYLTERDNEMHITVQIGQQDFDDAVITTITGNPDAGTAIEDIIG